MTEEGPTLRDDVKWGAAVMLVVILGTATITTGLWNSEPVGTEQMSQYQTPDGKTQPGIADVIFQEYVVAFEILGVLLLAALVGAIVIAVREENL